MAVDMIQANLIVIYTEQFDDCRDFYAGLGLTFAREQHGAGPEHYAATLSGGVVFEIYPATSRRPATGSLRLGLTVPGSTTAPLAPGRHILTDPDGRTIDLHVTQEIATN
ncbi:glyoxalase/bleomycin resistance/dioxygenase family protein [Streptosporangium sp. NPDC002607]